MKDITQSIKNDAIIDDLHELELTDKDIIGAMQEISGYLDISTDDFRTIYHSAHKYALKRLFKNFRPENIMRKEFESLRPNMNLDEAAKTFVCSGLKSLPVVDEKKCVIGILTETDYLQHLKLNSLLELLLGIINEGNELKLQFNNTKVSEVMTTPAVTVSIDASFQEVLGSFQQHNGRSTPVVENQNNLVGLLFRKDFINLFSKEFPN